MLANVQGIAIILLILGLGSRLAPKGVSIAGHDAGQLFLLAALPLFFIDFGTSAEYAAAELHHVLAEHNLQAYAPYGVWAIALLNIAFGSLYIYALGVFRDGGGASTASLRYLGPTVTIMVAFLLLEDYILTVVVSSLSGADQLLSTINQLEAAPVVHILLGVGIAWLTCYLTVRGRRDSSRVTFLVLFTYVTLMILTFASLFIQTSQGLQPVPLPQPDAQIPVGTLIADIGNAVLHGLVALTGLEAVSNGLLFIKDQDPLYVKWGKERLPRLAGLWNFLSGRVGSARTIQFGFLFYGGLTTALNSHFANYFNVLDGTNGRTLVGNLAFIGLMPIGGALLYTFRQIWASLTLSFANVTAYEDMQSTAYRDGIRGTLPIFLVYRAPNGSFTRSVYMTFIVSTIIMVLVNGNTSAAIPFYGIGVFGPIAFMGFSVSRHLMATKPKLYRTGSAAAISIGCLSIIIFLSQIVGKFAEGGWIRLVTFSTLFIGGHILLLSRNGERDPKFADYLVRQVSRIQGTMAELLLWQAEMMQTYRSNLWARYRAYRTKTPVESKPYPPYLVHFDSH